MMTNGRYGHTTGTVGDVDGDGVVDFLIGEQRYSNGQTAAGVLDGPTGEVSGQLAAHFYDHQGNLLAVVPIWQTTDYNQPTAPQAHSGTAVHATATQMRVGLTAVLVCVGQRMAGSG